MIRRPERVPAVPLPADWMQTGDVGCGGWTQGTGDARTLLREVCGVIGVSLRKLIYLGVKETWSMARSCMSRGVGKKLFVNAKDFDGRAKKKQAWTVVGHRAKGSKARAWLKSQGRKRFTARERKMYSFPEAHEFICDMGSTEVLMTIPLAIRYCEKYGGEEGKRIAALLKGLKMPKKLGVPRSCHDVIGRKLMMTEWDWHCYFCILYRSDAADEGLAVDLGGGRIMKKRTKK